MVTTITTKQLNGKLLFSVVGAIHESPVLIQYATNCGRFVNRPYNAKQ